VERPQGRLGQGAAHRVDDHVGAAGERLPQGRSQVAGGVVDQAAGAGGAGRVELGRRGGDGRDRGPQPGAELHGGQPHATARAEHHQLVAGLQRGDRSEGVERGAVGHAEGGRVLVGHARGRAGERHRGHEDLLGEGAVQHGAEHPVADGEVGDVGARLQHLPGQLAAGDERRRDAQLVAVGDEQGVGEVDRCGAHAHPHLPRPRGGGGQVLDLEDLRGSVGRADGGAHREMATSPQMYMPPFTARICPVM
jgi:hypothetical protein